MLNVKLQRFNIKANLSSNTGENMKSNYLLAAIVSVVGLVCSISVLGQDPKIAAAAGDRYVISAKAGGVNFVAGAVSVTRTACRMVLLLSGDDL